MTFRELIDAVSGHGNIAARLYNARTRGEGDCRNEWRRAGERAPAITIAQWGDSEAIKEGFVIAREGGHNPTTLEEAIAFAIADADAERQQEIADLSWRRD